MKKLLLFALLMVVTGLLADGVQPDGSGTEADPYQMATLDNLLWVSTNDTSWASHFIQTADIDAGDTQNWNDGEGFSPIGTNYAFSFYGCYDGQEHTIDGLHINHLDLYIGMFGRTDCATIENLGVTNVEVDGGSYVGGLVGMNNESLISNCYSTGSVNGYAYHYTGGLVGLNSCSTVNCCYSTCSVSGYHCIGGLVGGNGGNRTVSSSYSTGNVSGNDTVGGLVGSNYYNATISDCYSTGSVSGTGNYIGGLVGRSYNTDALNSFWDTETSGQSTSGSGTGKTTAEMQDVATFTSLATTGLDEPWDFVGNPFDDTGVEDYWNIDGTTNSGYPFLTDLPVGIADDEAVPPPASAITLHPNFPNPFNPTTTIRFSVPERQSAMLEIFNLRGQLVRSYPAFAGGSHEVVWNGVDNSGYSVGSGVYLYRLQAGGHSITRRMVLLK
ncbi:MAG: T9SS type A sorting domain-containing protein [Candidatus Cloacimonetes bacterium]|nr:T9SS type A sorting domain-containing protein [Candidatus Cloacimonadota bacterium]